MKIGKSPLITVMLQAAGRAARSLAHDFGEVEKLQVSRKGPGDFVSKADKAAERLIHTELSKARPKFSFLMKERGEIRGEDRANVWVVDPLDGSTNFLHGIPQFAISIALVRDGEPIAAVVYNPITDEQFTAERGDGAYLNNQRIRVSGRNQAENCVVAASPPSIVQPNHKSLREIGHIGPQVSLIHSQGASALDLAYVACGRYDGYWQQGLKAWDIAAGVLLVTESGGYVSYMSSKLGSGKFDLYKGEILAANPSIHRFLKEQLATVPKTTDFIKAQ